MAVKKAIVLAAGLGTRLRPLTCSIPKPLLPVWGEPMLSLAVARLREAGVEDIVVNCHYLHGQIEAWCAANGCRASVEPEILGTGGVLNPLRGWIGDDPFLLVNGDVVVEGGEGLFGLDHPFAAGEIAHALVVEDGPRTIEVEPESGFVTNWRSDDAGFPGTFTYCGFALLSPDVLRYVVPSGFSSVVQAYERAMADGLFVKAVAPDGLLWTDAGTISSYIDLNRDGDENAFAEIPQVARALAATAGRGGSAAVEFLGARGSDRVFFRAGGRVVVMHDDSKRPENSRYAGHAKWLRDAGVPVPEMLSDDPADSTTVFEWAGAERRMSFEEYTKAVEALYVFNTSLDRFGEPPDGLEPAFGPDLWRWERDLFGRHCLGERFAMECPASVTAELESVAARLDSEPVALVHRDFQSANILWKNGSLSIIDFQGMRRGPAVYDLASLLYDPYASISPERRRALAALYGKLAGRPGIADVLPFAAVQRLVQCLGAYGRLASVGQPQFGKHVLPALENLLAAADEADLDAVGALAEDLISKEQGRRRHAHGCGCGGHGEGEA